MKRLIQLPTVLCAALLFQGGCATNQIDVRANIQKSIPYLRPAAALVCANTLNFAVSDADRKEVAAYVSGIASGIRSLSGGKTPTPEELKAVIDRFTPNGSRWVTLGTSIGSIYGGVFPQIGSDGKLALQVLEALAAGCNDAAGGYLERPDSSTTP